MKRTTRQCQLTGTLLFLVMTTLEIVRSDMGTTPPMPEGSPTPVVQNGIPRPPIDIGKDGTGFVAIPERELLLERNVLKNNMLCI